MKFKKSLLIIGLVICLFAMASASASDVNDTAMEAAQSDEMTASDDSNVMEQSDDEELILEDNDVDEPILGEGASTGSFTDLDYLINNQYGSNDTITLSCNYTFNGTDDDDSGFIHGIGINRGVTIDGKGCTIDGSQKARIFNIGKDGAVKFLNINFINGKATGSGWEGDGGAIMAMNWNCVVEGCNFTNNTADDQGGALSRVNAYNCVFTGNKAYNGGAILGGSAYNCVFTGNTAEGSGGAIYIGSAYNCTFTGNTAEGSGGAINDGDAYNCTFTGNTAKGNGGAINRGSAYNCTFTGNTANYYGGAMMGVDFEPEFYSATLCIFDSNPPDEYRYIRIVEAVLSADNLTTSYKSGDRLLFNLTADNTNYTGFNTTIKIYQDEQEIGTYYALSGEGWIVDLNPGTYNAVLSLDKYEGVTNGTATITITEATFWDLNQTINGNTNDTITLDRDYAYNQNTDNAFKQGIRITRPVTINGNGHTIDAKGNASVFYISASDVTIKNLTIRNAYIRNGYGGAIYLGNVDSCIVSQCNFINNTAKYGGAICGDGPENSVISQCIFINNFAESGGAIYWDSQSGNASNCVFLNNNADEGSAIYIYPNSYLTADYCWFGNTATDYDGDLPISGSCTNWMFLNATVNPDAIAVSETSDIIFKLFLYNSTSGNITEYDNAPFENLNLTIASTNGNVSKNTAKLGEIIKYNATNIGTGSVTASIENVAYTIELNIKYYPDLSVQSQEADYGRNSVITLVYNSTATGTVNITLKGKNRNYTFEKELNATISLGNIDADEYEVNVIYSGDNVFFNATATGKLTINKANSTLTINDNVTFDYNTNGSTTVSFTNATGVNASVVGQPNAIVVVNDTTITVAGLNTGNYTLTVTTITDANHNNVTKNATITVNKAKTQLTADAITTTYNINKDLVIALKDAYGNALGGVGVTVDLNGAKTYVTDANGQIRVSTKGLTPKTYTAKITFNGNANYAESSKDVKVTVKKAKPKIIAKKKTYKAKKKTKKFTITLKDNKGKAIKNVKVRLIVQKIKKTNKNKNKKSKKNKKNIVKTNKKGKATFKINRHKKGKYLATVKFYGNKYYAKTVKKVKINMK
ncbi:hypothetical protein [Methanobrevibacter sp.]|uniref:hypothetical protein n=1 Tax=Methanobrevibacter sp. TaxID=66852 RepID=UPI00386D0B11